MSNKVAFREKKMFRGQKEHYHYVIIMKAPIHPEDIIVLNVYTPSTEFQNMGSENIELKKETQTWL